MTAGPRRRGSRGVTLIELLVAIAIVLALSFGLIAIYFSFNPPQRPVPNTVLVGAWTTAPASAQVSVQETFVYTLQEASGLTGLTNKGGVEVQFVSGPGRDVTIVSMNGTAVNSDRGRATTTNAGTITVVVQATTVPAAGEGALVAIPVGRTQPVTVASFEIYQ